MTFRKRRRAGLVLGLAGACAVSASARAQIATSFLPMVIGNTVSQMTANGPDTACEPWASKKARVLEGMDRTMQAYVALNGQSDAKALREVFALNKKDARWKDASGEVAIEKLGAKLDHPAETLAPVGVEVGGDLRTAKGVYRLMPSGETDEAKASTLTVDFVVQPGTFGPKGALIWHMTVYEPGTAPHDAPKPFCHFEVASAY